MVKNSFAMKRRTVIFLYMYNWLAMTKKWWPEIALCLRITELWQFKSHKVEKVDEEDHLSFFKAGLWKSGFLDVAKNGTIFSRNLW